MRCYDFPSPLALDAMMGRATRHGGADGAVGLILLSVLRQQSLQNEALRTHEIWGRSELPMKLW